MAVHLQETTDLVSLTHEKRISIDILSAIVVIARTVVEIPVDKTASCGHIEMVGLWQAAAGRDPWRQ